MIDRSFCSSGQQVFSLIGAVGLAMLLVAGCNSSSRTTGSTASGTSSNTSSGLDAKSLGDLLADLKGDNARDASTAASKIVAMNPSALSTEDVDTLVDGLKDANGATRESINVLLDEANLSIDQRTQKAIYGLHITNREENAKKLSMLGISVAAPYLVRAINDPAVPQSLRDACVQGLNSFHKRIDPDQILQVDATKDLSGAQRNVVVQNLKQLKLERVKGHIMRSELALLFVNSQVKHSDLSALVNEAVVNEQVPISTRLRLLREVGTKEPEAFRNACVSQLKATAHQTGEGFSQIDSAYAQYLIGAIAKQEEQSADVLSVVAELPIHDERLYATMIAGLMHADPASPSLTKALGRGLKSEDANVVQQAITSLHACSPNHQDTHAVKLVPQLVGLLASEKNSSLASALLMRGAYSETAKHLQAMHKDGDDQRREFATKWLKQLGFPEEP